VAITKCELPDAAAAAELLSESLGHEVLQISAATGEGLPELVRRVAQMLKPDEEL
jgi:GTP-binding protein